LSAIAQDARVMANYSECDLEIVEAPLLLKKLKGNNVNNLLHMAISYKNAIIHLKWVLKDLIMLSTLIAYAWMVDFVKFLGEMFLRFILFVIRS